MGKRTKPGPSGHVHGVLVVDKPSGLTSHDVVARARRAFGTRRVGHAGTLDPMATGVLLLLFGEATKLSSVLTTESKRYRARVQFGVGTDTLDADGQVNARQPLAVPLTEAALQAALSEERTRRSQMPPQISAIKVEGKRAYQLARQGREAALTPRVVSVQSLELCGHGADWAELELEVSKGFYVRSLARDLAERLGTKGHLSALRRIASGVFHESESVELPERAVPLLPVADVAARSLPWMDVSATGRDMLRQGKRLPLAEVTSGLQRPPGVRFLSSDARNTRPETIAAFSPAAQAAPSGSSSPPARELIALVTPAEPDHFRVLRGISPMFEDVSASPAAPGQPGGERLPRPVGTPSRED